MQPRQRRSTNVGSHITINVRAPGATIDINPRPSTRPRPTISIETRKSSKFSVDDPENDWYCLSSDNVVYGIRSDHARVCSRNIYDPDSPDVANDDIEWHIKLNASSAVLDFLFEYFYNKRRTNLETIAFDTLVELTVAAEQYAVQSAIDACRVALRKHIPENPLRVLEIAGKYGYHEELSQAAPYIIDETLPVIECRLPQNLLMPWCIYRDQFIDTHRFALSSYPTDHRCQHWNEVVFGVLNELHGSPGAILEKVEVTFLDAIEQVRNRNGVNACCIPQLRIWYGSIVARRNVHVPLQIPVLSD